MSTTATPTVSEPTNGRWIRVYLSMMRDPILKPTGKYSRMEAWLDLVFQARYGMETKSVELAGGHYRVERGQTLVSIQGWSGRWSWTPPKVTRFLDELEKAGRIKRESWARGTTRLTIVGFSDYNGFLAEQTLQQTLQPSSDSSDGYSAPRYSERYSEPDIDADSPGMTSKINTPPEETAVPVGSETAERYSQGVENQGVIAHRVTALQQTLQQTLQPSSDSSDGYSAPRSSERYSERFCLKKALQEKGFKNTTKNPSHRTETSSEDQEQGNPGREQGQSPERELPVIRASESTREPKQDQGQEPRPKGFQEQMQDLQEAWDSAYRRCHGRPAPDRASISIMYSVEGNLETICRDLGVVDLTGVTSWPQLCKEWLGLAAGVQS